MTAIVHLDGVQISDVLEIEAEVATVVRVKRDQAGKIVSTPDGTGIEFERLTGKVRVMAGT